METPICFFADRSERGKLRFGGTQRAWFLHQVVTQAFEDIEPGEARDAALLTPHGRMIGFFETIAASDYLYSHFEPELRPTLQETLERYVFATDVHIDDVTDQMGLVLVGGEGWRDATSRVDGALVHETRSIGVPAAYLWVASDDVAVATEALRGAGSVEMEEQGLEELRVAHGVPRWGRDMDARTLPQEAGIDAFAVHYEKGCYLGQEAMAKIHFRGKVNRKLRRIEPDDPVQPGQQVTSNGDAVGVVTSSVDRVALAMLRHTVQPGARVRVGETHARVMDG